MAWSGGSNPNLQHTFKIGRGMSEDYKRRAVVAIHSRRSKHGTLVHEGHDIVFA